MGPCVGHDWPCTMSTLLQNPHWICCVAHSVPSCTTQPLTHRLPSRCQADTQAAEGPGKRKALEGSGLKAACVVWWPKLLRLLRFWARRGEECHEMNDGCLFLWGGTLASSGSGWGWGAALGMPTCLVPGYTGKNSKSYLAPFTSLPSSCTHSPGNPVLSAQE